MTNSVSDFTLNISSTTSRQEAGGIFAYEVKKNNDSSISVQESFSLAGLLNPSHIAFTNNGKLLLAVTESPNLESSRIHAWKLKEDDGQKLDSPQHLGDWPVGGTDSCQIVVHRNDRFIFVANYGDGSLSAFKDAAKRGDLVRCNSYKFKGGSRVVPGKQDSSHISSIVISPNDNYIFATDTGSDCIWKTSYSILCGFEFLTELPQPFLAPDGSGPGSAVFAMRQDGMFLYIGCKFSNHLLVYWVNEEDFGALEQIQYVPVIPREENGDQKPSTDDGITDMQISNDQKNLYVASKFRNAISVFNIYTEGNANFIQWVESGGCVPRSLALVAAFGLLLVAHEKTNDLTAFLVDNKSGNLEGRAPINGNKRLELNYEPCSLKVQ